MIKILSSVSEGIKGGKHHIRAEIAIDSAAELTVEGFQNYHFTMGSIARDVSTGDFYGLGSDGTWKKQNSGFTPTDAQLDAMNSGIDSTKVEQIATNQSNIDGQQNATSSGGNGYALINGIRLYVASSAPTGDIPDGSVGVGW
ncbi:MAG: hypothetical protein BWX63_02318 [Bacteroidetes bacterium ADurb.Bin041]|nr:MAG: hypothetical protein BWX63_02318 [Bacteroidetes bacterium ADurb.Bin041]